MAEQTTTEAPEDAGAVQTIQGVAVDDQGQAIAAQPDESEQAEAVEETTETVEEQATEQPETSSEVEKSDEDEQVEKYAQAKGLILDSENAKKAAKMAMNAEKLAGKQASRAGELEKTMGQMSDTSAEQVAQATGQDPELIKRLQRMEVKDSIREFWESNPDARKYEAEMAEIAQSAGLFGSPEAILKASYAMARSNDVAGIKSQAKQETLRNLAQKQQAAVPTGHAVNSISSSDAITPQNVDRLVGSHDLAWFEAHREEINAALAG